MNTVLHIKEQGLRVHKLAKLGGLVALAGLENMDPALLLGAFLELAAQLPQLGLHHVTELRHHGLQKLSERKKEKKEKNIARPDDKVTLPLNEVTLTRDEIKRLITRLGGKVPVWEKDMVPELYRLMR